MTAPQKRLIIIFGIVLLVSCLVLAVAGSAQTKTACFGNINPDDASGDMAPLYRKLGIVEMYGGNGIRGGPGGTGYTGGGGARMEKIAGAIRPYGWRWALIVNGTRTEEAALTQAQVTEGGRQLGPVLARISDVLVPGVAIGNEPDKPAEDAPTAAERERVLDQQANLVIWFATGVRQTCPTCVIAAGEMGGSGNREIKVAYYRRLAPHVQSGLIANVVKIHLYRGDEVLSRDKTTMAVDLEEYVRGLIRDAGWPDWVQAEIHSTETGLARVDFDDDAPGDFYTGARTFINHLHSFASVVCTFGAIGAANVPRWTVPEPTHSDTAPNYGDAWLLENRDWLATDSPPDTICTTIHHPAVVRTDTTYTIHPAVYQNERYWKWSCVCYRNRLVLISEAWTQQTITTTVVSPAYDETVCTTP